MVRSQRFYHLLKYVTAVLVIGTVRVFSCPIPAIAEPMANEFVIGRISTLPEESLKNLAEMSGFLSDHLVSTKGLRFREIVVPDTLTMAALLKASKVDMISETPVAAIALEQSCSAEILLREWKSGVPDYVSLMVTRRDTQINSLEDLRGHVVAFEDRGSTSGFLLPFAYMRLRGLKLEELASRKATPLPDTVGYVFAGHEINIASLVARDIVDAGAISDLNWDDPREVPPGIKERLRVFFVSAPVMRSVVLVRKSLPATIKAELVATLSAMHEDGIGREVMQRYHGVHRYDPINSQLVAQLEQVRTLYHVVADKVP